MTRKGIFKFVTLNDFPLIFISTVIIMISAAAPPLETYLYGKVISTLTKFLAGQYSSPSEFMGKIRFLCGEIVLLGVANWIVSWVGIIGWLLVGERSQIRGRLQILSALLQKQFVKMQHLQSVIGSLTQAHRCIEDIRVGVSENLGYLIQCCTTITFLFITSMIALWLLTLVIIASTPLMAISSFIFGKLAVGELSLENKHSSRASQILEWCFKSAEVTRILNGKYFDSAKFSQYVKLSAKAFKSGTIFVNANGSILRALAGIIFIQGLAFGQHLVKTGKTNSGQIFTAFGACLLLGTMLAALAANIALLNQAQASARSIENFEIFEDAIETNISEEKLSGSLNLESCRTLSVKDVSLHLNDKQILQNVNIEFTSSHINFLIGFSGSGKSSLSLLLAGLYEKSLGEVCIDGRDISLFSTEEVSKKITIIDLSSAIFKMLLRDNILLGSDVDQEYQLESALEFADLKSLACLLPDGIDSLIEESELSGGQIQKIGLARAYLRNPPILILDEALSAIDFRTTTGLFAKLRKQRMGKITIVITHDVNEIQDQDMVHIIESGRVEKFGKKSDVLMHEMSSPKQKSQIHKKISQSTVGLDSSVAPFSNFDAEAAVGLPFDETVTPLGIRAVVSFALQTSDSKMIFSIGLIGTAVTGLSPPVLSFLFSRLLSKIVAPTVIGSSSTSNSTMWLVVAAIITIFVDAVLYFVAKICIYHSLESWIVFLRTKCLAAISDQDMTFFNKRHLSPSDLTTLLMNDVRDLRSILSELIPHFLELLTLATTGVIWATISGWKLALVGFSFIPIVLTSAFAFNRLLHKVETDYKANLAILEDHCNRTISGIKTIKALGMSDQWSTEYNQKLSNLMPYGIRRAIVLGFGLTFVPFCTCAANATILYYGVSLIASLEYTLQQMLMVMTMLIFTIAGANSLIRSLPKVSRGQRAAQLISRILSMGTLPIETGGDEKFCSFNQNDTSRAVSFRNVHFSYADKECNAFKTILRDVSLNVKVGERITLVGSSGSGKSTLGKLLLRLYESDRGSIEVFGHPARLVEPDLYRSLVTMIPQKAQFFEGTIRENLVYGNRQAYISEDRIMEALGASRAADIIEQLPKGLDTEYGAGISFSLGELQRLCFARALIRKPRLLILDEPTSHLDGANTKDLVDLINSGFRNFDKNMTVITITHDPLIMKQSPRILVLDEGRVKQDGTFDDLISRPGPFKRLLETIENPA